MPRRSQGVNINTLADEAGVSVATISRVMNRRTGVSEETRRKIESMLRRYNFKPDRKDPRPVRIAILVPWKPGEYYMQSLISGAYDYALEHNLDINVVSSHTNGMTVIEHIRDLQCSGVIVVQEKELRPELVQVLDSELPVVLVDCGFDYPGTGMISNDAYSGSRIAVEHLLTLGHRNIGFMKSHEAHAEGKECNAGTTKDHVQRYQGYFDALKKAGIEPQTHWIISGLSTNNNCSIGACGLVTMKQLLKQAPELTAVMTIDDSLAMGTYTAIHQSGMRIPEDISIVGFGNYFGCENWFPGLTTLEHPITRMGFLAAEAIDRALRNLSGWLPPRLQLPAELLVRQSTASPRQSAEEKEPVITSHAFEKIAK